MFFYIILHPILQKGRATAPFGKTDESEYITTGKNIY